MEEQLSLGLIFPADELKQLWTPDDIYDRLDEEAVRVFAEDRRVERKRGTVQANAMAEYLSMWSNTQPHGGLIFVGVEDDGRISGCKGLAPTHKNALEALSPLCPDARFACKEVAVRNERGERDYVLAYRVNYRPDKLVETGGGEAFIREGDKKLRITEGLKRELRIAKGEIHYELEDVTLRYPQDFDVKEVDRFCQSFFVNRRYQSDKSREELLELAKLGRREGRSFVPNLACALLFAKDPRDVVPGARIRVIRYEGTKEGFGVEMNSVFSTFIDGPIARLLFEAKPIIASQLRSFQRFGAGGRISLQQEYPEEAWFEAIVNAVAHRSYNFKTQNIFVKIFDDRFVVESPGGFVAPTTADTIYDAHNPRNPFLMEAMMHLELTFCGFEGTRRMRRAMQSAKLPAPRFRQIEAHSHQVHVTLENDLISRKLAAESEAYSKVSPELLASLAPEERQILQFMAQSGEMNITSASLLINRSWPTTSKIMSQLVDLGLVEVSTKQGRSRDSTKTYRLLSI
jgi:ATP-dependent DNA helicase RecG